MEKIFALIKNGVVVNTIVADDDFIDQIEDQYDHCVDTSDMIQRPPIGWSYDGSNFTPPAG